MSGQPDIFFKGGPKSGPPFSCVGRIPAMNAMLVKPLSRIILFIVACWLLPLARAATPGENARQTIVQAILAEDDAKKRDLITTLAGSGDEAITRLFTAWKEDALFIYTA